MAPKKAASPSAQWVEGYDPNASLNKRVEDIVVAEVVRLGDKLVVPDRMSLQSAINVLTEQMQDEETKIVFTEVIKCFPWEGAIAFRKAVEQLFGYSRTVGTPSFFGERPPSEISIETGVNTKVSAPWGRFSFALAEGDDEYIQTTTAEVDGRTVFQIGAVIRKKHRSVLAKLADLTREFVERESIYRGKAIKIAFTSDSGATLPIPTPSFLDLDGGGTEQMVYSKALEDLMEYNVFTLLRHTDACRAAKIPLKRGVLLAGKYGTGKSLFARAVAKEATGNAWTYIYIRNAGELPEAIKFAKMYQPCVIFAEDVDRHMAGGRTESIDEILNTLDGIDSKKNEIMVVLTTNHLDQVNQAMLRPGRLDVILEVTPPDAEAVTRLIRAYGKGLVEESTDLGPTGDLLAGQTPAIIREAVERSKLASISRTGDPTAQVTGSDLVLAAQTMMQQIALLQPAPLKVENWGEGLVRDVAQQVHTTLKGNGLGKIDVMATQVTQILESI